MPSTHENCQLRPHTFLLHHLEHHPRGWRILHEVQAVAYVAAIYGELARFVIARVVQFC